MRINKRKVVPALALIGLTLGTAGAVAAEAAGGAHGASVGHHASHRQADPVGHKKKENRRKHFEDLIESNDYEAFRRMVADTPMAEIINTQDKFDALVESHDLREDGRHAEAREVLEDAGIKPPKRPVRMHR